MELNFILPRACEAQAVLARYSVASQELRMFLHYPPSCAAAGPPHLLFPVILNFARHALQARLSELHMLLSALVSCLCLPLLLPVAAAVNTSCSRTAW